MADIKPKKAVSVTERLGDMRRFIHNPNGMIDIQFKELADMIGGRKEDIGVSNPVAYCIEQNALTGAFTAQEIVISSRNDYPILANTELALHRHMTDKDFMNRFSSPAKATVNLNVLYNEFLTKSRLEPETNDRVFIIPRYLEIKVRGLTYTTMSPIEIRRTDVGGVVSLRYLLETNDPIFPVNQGYIKFAPRTEFFRESAESQGHKEMYLSFDVELQEIEVGVKNLEILKTSPPKGVFSLPEGRMFYYLRALHSRDGVNYEEMIVNHSEDIWDVRTPTCLVNVITDDNYFSYYIPPDYIKTGQVGAWLKFVLYTTKGPVNIDYGEIPLGEYSTSYAGIFPTKPQYPNIGDGNIDKLHLLMPIPMIEGRVIGGKPQKTLAQLKHDVIQNNLVPNIPITEVQLYNSLRNTDLTPVKGYDVVTGREFLVKTKVPSSISEYGITRMSLDMIEHKTSFEDLSNNKNKIVVVNDKIVILPQNTLFENDKERGLRILSIQEARELEKLSGQPLVKVVNERNIMGSYYHYVLDSSGITTQLRPYDLSKPRILRNVFKDYNTTCEIGINTAKNASKITRTNNGYRIDFLVDINLFDPIFSVHNIKPVLIYVATGGVNFYLEGKLNMDVVNNPVFTFYINTDGYINDKNRIMVKNFKTHTGDFMDIDLDLTQDLELLFYTNAYPKTFKPKEMDSFLMGSYLTGNVAAITMETHTFEFGVYLERLYSRVHTSTGLEIYKRHEQPVYHKHTTTRFNKDNTIKWKKGEYVLDSNGDKIVQYNVGDVMLDENGQPIIVGNEDLAKYLNIMLVDYRVVRSTGQQTMRYKDHVRQTVNSLVLNNMVEIQADLYNITEAFLTVPNGLTDIVARSDNKFGYMSSAQSFKFFVHVNSRIYNDHITKTSIEEVIKETLDEYLTGRIELSRIELLSLVYERTKEFVKSIKLDKFTELDGEYIRIESDNAEIAIKKRLKVTPDGYDVVDDVSYIFVKED